MTLIPSRWNKSIAEMDYMARHVINLFQALFSSRSKIQVEWYAWNRRDQSCLPNALYIGILCHSRIKYVICVTNQRRSDMLFTSEYGIEVGNGELKPPGSNTALLDEDRARISELCKWQLHTRLKESRSEQECVTYGILIAGKDLYFIPPTVFIAKF